MIIFRYVFGSILQSTVAVSLVLLLIVSSGRLAKYLNKASTGDLAPELVFSIIFFRIPEFLPLIIPLGLFVGILLVYGRMYLDSEMIVLNAAGVSKWQLLGLTLAPAFFISVLVAVLTLWLAPASLVQVESRLEAAKNFHGLMFFREGKFQSSGRANDVVYIEKLPTKNSFEGVFVVEQGRDGGISMLVAREGEARQGAESDLRELHLREGAIYEGSVGRNDFQLSRFATYQQTIRLKPEQETLDLQTDALPTLALLESDDRLRQAALHWRFSLPASVIVVSILAMALSKTDRRKGRYMAMLPAILLYLVYILSLSAVRSAIEAGDVFVYSLWLTHLFFFAIAMALAFREELLSGFGRGGVAT